MTINQTIVSRVVMSDRNMSIKAQIVNRTAIMPMMISIYILLLPTFSIRHTSKIIVQQFFSRLATKRLILRPGRYMSYLIVGHKAVWALGLELCNRVDDRGRKCLSFIEMDM